MSTLFNIISIRLIRRASPWSWIAGLWISWEPSSRVHGRRLPQKFNSRQPHYSYEYEENEDVHVVEGFLERLLPFCSRYLEPRSVIFMDNASFHFFSSKNVIISKLQGNESITDEEIASTVSCSTRTVRHARQKILEHGTINAPRKTVGRPREATENM